MENNSVVFELLKKYRLVLVGVIFLILIISVVLIFFRVSLFRSNEISIPVVTPIPVPTSSYQKPFQVLSTTPANNLQNVYPGKIKISFTTDTDILSEQSFSIRVTPPLSHNLLMENNYPTKIITAQMQDNLQPNSIYTVRVLNSHESLVYSWTFTTSSQSSADNPGVLENQQKILTQQYYPLLPYLPYSTSDFAIQGYDARLTLSVTIKTSDVSLAKQEINEWIKSHGVDPSTHIINYVNGY